MKKQMYKVYTGLFGNKHTVAEFDDMNDAIIKAWDVLDRTSSHAGVISGGSIIFHTNFEDPEFLLET